MQTQRLSRTQARQSQRTLLQLSTDKLERLCRALGYEHLAPKAARALEQMSSGWGALPILTVPYWPSDITDDGTPVEFSVVLGGAQPELRLLVEPQQLPGDLQSNWQAGLKLTETLAVEQGASTRRFEEIRRLFAPDPAQSARFSIWHSVAYGASGETSVKVYLNPAIAGREEAPSRVQQALDALGMSAAWSFLSEHVGTLGDYVYFALDMADTDSARVKVYAAYDARHVQEVDRRLAAAGMSSPGELAAWVESLTGGRAEPDSRPLQVCYSFWSGSAAPGATLYVPIRSSCNSDADALARTKGLLPLGDAAALERSVQAMIDRPLSAGRGMITYVARRVAADDPRVTIYLSPELYSVAATRPHDGAEVRTSMIRGLHTGHGAGAPPVSFARVLNVIEARRNELSAHPFLQHLRSAYGSLEEVQRISSRVAFFVMCFQDVLRLVYQLTSDPFLKRLAHTHALEDKGHDRWYLNDLQRLGATVELRDVFSPEGEAIRDVAYTQISDVMRSADDHARLAVVLALEAAGGEFFQSMIQFVERQKRSAGLMYFARKHQQVEQSHDVLAEEAQNELASLSLRPEAVPEVLAVVDRTFESMVSLADRLLAELPARGGVGRKGAA